MARTWLTASAALIELPKNPMAGNLNGFSSSAHMVQLTGFRSAAAETLAR